MHRGLEIPPGDMLIHAGDLTLEGSWGEIMNAFRWLNKMPHEHIIFVPGNHDYGFLHPDLAGILRERFKRVTVLLDRGITIAGKRIYGSPYQPYFNDWAFNFAPPPAGYEEAAEKWDEIPDDSEILITHGPVYGILDTTLRKQHVGCVQLKDRLKTLEGLRLYVSGHIHEAYGTTEIDRTLYVNACVCNSSYRPIQKPIVVDLDESGAHTIA
jgi:Icc-related predicted phosphoesterase